MTVENPAGYPAKPVGIEPITPSNTYTEIRGLIEPYDSRIAQIWERAGEIATAHGFGEQFDFLMLELGTGYKRSRLYSVSVVTNVTLTIPVVCTGKQDPVNMISSEDIKSYLSEDATLTDWEISEIVRERYEH